MVEWLLYAKLIGCYAVVVNYSVDMETALNKIVPQVTSNFVTLEISCNTGYFSCACVHSCFLSSVTVQSVALKRSGRTLLYMSVLIV